MPVLSQVKVKFLDGKTKDYNVHWKSLASLLIQNVNKDLDLQQSDFFGLQFNDREDNCVFLDPTKKMDEQIKSSKLVARELRHVVRFYPHNTEDLEEYTTYLLALQMRSDVHMGAYHKCMEKNVLVYMLATILQSVYGDHELPEGANANYISNLEILPSSLDGQEKDEILQLVRQKHVELRNMSGGEADKKLLEISSKQSMYGLKFLPTQDSKGNNLKISPNHQGVVVYNGYERRDLYSWMKIRKLAFKKNKLLLKLKHDSNPSKKGSTVELTMSSRDCCKNMWKNCVENYAFFKLESQPKPKPKPLVFKRGSTFRYSGRTNKQLHEMRLTSNFKRSKFERLSLRAPSTKFSSSTTSLSARSDQITSIDEGSYTLQENNSNANNTDQSLSKIVEQIEDKFNKKAFTDERPASTNRQSTDWKVESGDLHSNTAASLATTTTQQTTDPSQPEKRSFVETPVIVTSPEGDVTSSKQSNRSSIPSPATLHSSGAITQSQSGGFNMTSLSNVTSPQQRHQAVNFDQLKSSTVIQQPHRIGDRRSASSAYFILKELLTTERTYCRDLSVICTDFRKAVSEVNFTTEEERDEIFHSPTYLLQYHENFLTKLEQVLYSIDNKSRDLLTDDQYTSVEQLITHHVTDIRSSCRCHIENCLNSVEKLEEVCIRDPKMESCYRDFELDKSCYIPLGSFYLKPMARIFHYKTLLQRLTSHYRETGMEGKLSHAERGLEECEKFSSHILPKMEELLNAHKLHQLKRDLIGVDRLLSYKPNRKFIREGVLYKLSRKGFQQRLFFLFSDCLTYTSTGVTSTNQFKVNNCLPLSNLLIEVHEGEKMVANCFSVICPDDKIIVLAAASSDQMNKWLVDLRKAVGDYKCDDVNTSNHLGIPLDHNNLRDSQLSVSSETSSSIMTSQLQQQRANTTMHVCWHRNTSVAGGDHMVSLSNHMSGYLLRKFKNSNGWQKLWVVFTQFCLFFYKSHHDQFPLASLPLLGYSVTTPSEGDDIHKDFVFKLQFKTHVYFFRAESLYNFDRWMEVISSTTNSQ